jgi:hypothetical protein
VSGEAGRSEGCADAPARLSNASRAYAGQIMTDREAARARLIHRIELRASDYAHRSWVRFVYANPRGQVALGDVAGQGFVERVDSCLSDHGLAGIVLASAVELRSRVSGFRRM